MMGNNKKKKIPITMFPKTLIAKKMMFENENASAPLIPYIIKA